MVPAMSLSYANQWGGPERRARERSLASHSSRAVIQVSVVKRPPRGVRPICHLSSWRPTCWGLRVDSSQRSCTEMFFPGQTPFPDVSQSHAWLLSAHTLVALTIYDLPICVSSHRGTYSRVSNPGRSGHGTIYGSLLISSTVQFPPSQLHPLYIYEIQRI